MVNKGKDLLGVGDDALKSMLVAAMLCEGRTLLELATFTLFDVISASTATVSSGGFLACIAEMQVFSQDNSMRSNHWMSLQLECACWAEN